MDIHVDRRENAPGACRDSDGRVGTPLLTRALNGLSYALYDTLSSAGHHEEAAAIPGA